MKLHNRIAAVVAAVALCAGAFTASASADEVSLKIAGQHPIDHFGTEALNQIEADLEAADVGLSVKTFPAGQLGYGERKRSARPWRWLSAQWHAHLTDPVAAGF